MPEEPQPEKLARLNRLEALSDSDLETVVRAGRHVHLPANWSLIWERTPADKAYLIVDGEVSVRKGGQEVTRLGPGDVIGEMAIVNHRLRSASVVSLTPLEVIHYARGPARAGPCVRRGPARHVGRPARDLLRRCPPTGRSSRWTATRWSSSSSSTCSAATRR